MNKKVLLAISVVVILALAGGGYYFWKIKTKKAVEAPKSAAEQATEDIQKTTSAVSSEVGKNIIPNATATAINPIQTDANPYNKTNPFSNSNLKVNPFQ